MPFHIENPSDKTPFYIVEQHINHCLRNSRQHDVEGRPPSGLWTTDQLLLNLNYFANFPFLSEEAIADNPSVRNAVYSMRVRSEATTMNFSERNPEWFRNTFRECFVPASQSARGISVLINLEKKIKNQEDLEIKTTLRKISEEVRSEIAFYEGLRERCCADGLPEYRRRVLKCYRALLPVWILRQELCSSVTPNLYGLDFWDGNDSMGWVDSGPLGCLLDDLSDCFAGDIDPGTVEYYKTCVRGEYEGYREFYNERDELFERNSFGLSVIDLHKRLGKGGDLALPEWVEHKANLIWNFIVCPVFGLEHCMPSRTEDVTRTSSDGLEFGLDECALGIGSGQVPVMQMKSSVCEEIRVERVLNLSGRSSSKGLVMLFGHHYSDSYWSTLLRSMDKAIIEFFAWNSSVMRSQLQKAAQGYFSPQKIADIKRTFRAAQDPLSCSKWEVLVPMLPIRLTESMDEHFEKYYRWHPYTLIKTNPNPEPEDECPTVGDAVTAACREFERDMNKQGVKIDFDDLSGNMLGVVRAFFNRELGSTREEARRKDGEQPLLFGLIFDEIDKFFERNSSSPCKPLLWENMTDSLYDWRSASRKSIDRDEFSGAVHRAIDVCCERERKLFCVADCKGASRRHFALFVEDGKLMMCDLGSRNGSYVVREKERKVYAFRGQKSSESAKRSAQEEGYDFEELASDVPLQANRGDVLTIGPSKFQIG